MNIVDSSGWLEYFADGPNAEPFAEPLRDVAGLLVPAITLYEVFKIVCRQRGEDAALQAIALMQQGQVVDLNDPLALLAAKISLEIKLPMADSIILATGYDTLDPTPMHPYGYGRYRNVYTALEFERLSNATGPTGGKILIRDADGQFTLAPRSVALLHLAIKLALALL